MASKSASTSELPDHQLTLFAYSLSIPTTATYHHLAMFRSIAFRISQEVPADRVSFYEICLSCSMGWYWFSFEDRPFISLIFLSQNCMLSFLNFFRSFISLLISCFTMTEFSTAFSISLRLLVSMEPADLRLGQAVFCQRRCSDRSSLSKLFPSQLCCLYLPSIASGVPRGPTSDPVVLGPLSDLAPTLLVLMREFMVPMRSDYRSERSEMGCRVTLSFLLLISFSMMDRSLSLNFSSVSISSSCCWLSSFCCSISSKTSSTALLRDAFSWSRPCIA